MAILGASPSSIVGMYEKNLPFNNWHYVTITYDLETSTYAWENRANKRWTLYPTNKTDKLRVGEDCPYYESGYTVARITDEGVFGPHDLYIKQ